MVILLDLLNQRSNQFIQFIHLYAYCKERNINFYHLPFVKKYIHIYPNLKYCGQSKYKHLYLYIKSKIKRKLYPDSIISLIDDNVVEVLAQNPDSFKGKFVFCKGGRLRDDLSVMKNRDYFEKLFQPNIDIVSLKNTILKKNLDNQIILGVQIRRTDYINYADGMYYFEDDVYINYIKQIINLIGDNNKIILFTDDKSLDINRYEKEFKNIILSRFSIEEDYYLMGQCDYLLSTNSTFVLVASYLGHNKLYRFMGAQEKITSMELFKECTTANHTQEEAERAYLAEQEFAKK